MNFKSFNLKNPHPVSGQVYQYLKQAIINCEIEPGRSLSETAISSELKVSRQPVREAFIKLSECGLLNIFPQRGSVVAAISIQSVLEGQFVRTAIECAVIRKLTPQVTSTQLDELETILSEQPQHLSKQDYEAFLQADDRFHQQFANFAHYPLAWETIETIKPMMDRVRYLDITRDQSMADLIVEHRALLDALKAHDGEQAEKIITQHLTHFPHVIDDIRAKNPGWFIDSENR